MNEEIKTTNDTNNEVARLREELEKMKGEATREIMLRDKIEKRCEIAERELAEKTNEFARLREELEFKRKEYLSMSADLDCLQAHWMELSGIESWGQRISESVPDLVKAWKKVKSENEKLRELVEGLLSAGVGRMKLDEWRQLSEKYNQLTK